MTYEDTSAVYALNSYVWKLVEANLGWTTDDFEGAIPIIPSSQEPEFMQSGKSFIVYGSAIHGPRSLWAIRRESISYTIYSDSSTDANKVANLLADAFERQDEAAKDVNLHLEAEEIAGRSFRGVSFGTIGLNMIEKAEPADNEGGFVSAIVMLNTLYTVHNSTAQFTGFSYT